MALFLILVVAFLLVLGVTLLLWHVLAFLLGNRGHLGNLDGVTLLPGNIIYFILVDGVAVPIVVHVALLDILGGGVGLLYGGAFLPGFVPALLLVHGGTRGYTSLTAYHHTEQKDSLNHGC